MSKADKMFEELGYKKIETDEYVEYGHRTNYTCVNLWKDECLYDNDSLFTSIQEHLAIHEKLKELGWIE